MLGALERWVSFTLISTLVQNFDLQFLFCYPFATMENGSRIKS